MSSIKSRVILVTGASSGIGRNCAEYLHSLGNTVYGASRTRPVPDVAYSFMQMDVNSTESVQQCIREIISTDQRIDVVVNCAGFGIAGSVEDTSIDEAKAQFETNFFGVLRICQAVLPTMRKQKSGLIVNISSISGVVSFPFQGLYCASKFALEGMTEALRMEVGAFGIRAVLVEPGNFHTEFTSNRKLVGSALTSVHYRHQMDAVMSVVEKEEISGPSSIEIARLIERIIEDPHPKLRYSIGLLSERLVILLKKVLPSKLLEWLILKHYNLH